MPLTLLCSCGAKLRAREDLAGKYVRCPKCKQPVLVAAESAEVKSRAVPHNAPTSGPTASMPPVENSPPERFTSLGDRGTFIRENDERAPRRAETSPTSLGDRGTYDSESGILGSSSPADLGSLGDRGTRAGDDVVPPTHSPAAPTRLPTIPGYDILELLGHGGMGVVYKARHLKLKRLVALKMILSGAHASPKQLARFRAEAEAAARLRHPHVIQIYEIGDADGYPYLALEFAEGGSLEQKTRREPQPPREAAELVKSLAEAIEHCHQQQVVHRDLKPANVLIADGVAKITDFGLAKQLESPDEGETNHSATKTGAVLGTPSYMAPEQARGDCEVGPPADVYALGALLYELLTGRPPFTGSTPMETMQQVLEREPVAPGVLQPNVPRDLQTICLKCLRKEIPDRYASAIALAEDLRRFLAGEPILARPVGFIERTVKLINRHRLLSGLTAAAALLGIVGTWQWLKADAEYLQKIALRQAEYADQVFRLQQGSNASKSLDQFIPEPDEPDFRSWEWYFLKVKDRSDAHYFQATVRREHLTEFSMGHFGERVVSLAPIYNTSGHTAQLDLVISQIVDSTKRFTPLWSQPLATLTQYRAGVSKPQLLYTWAPDDSRLAVAEYGGGKATVWNANGGAPIATLSHAARKPQSDHKSEKDGDTANSGKILAITWSPNGKYLATEGENGNWAVTIWDTDDGRELQGYPANGPSSSERRSGIAWSPDGSLLAGHETIWNPFTGDVSFHIPHPSTKSSKPSQWQNGCLSAWHPDGNRLLVTDKESYLAVWSYSAGCELSRMSDGEWRTMGINAPNMILDIGWLATGDRFFIVHRESAFDRTTLLDPGVMKPVLQIQGKGLWDAFGRRAVFENRSANNHLTLVDPWRSVSASFSTPDHRIAPLPVPWRQTSHQQNLEAGFLLVPRLAVGSALLILGLLLLGAAHDRSPWTPVLRTLFSRIVHYAFHFASCALVLVMIQLVGELILNSSIWANVVPQTVACIAAVSIFLARAQPNEPTRSPAPDQPISRRLHHWLNFAIQSGRDIASKNTKSLGRICVAAGILHLLMGSYPLL